MSFNNLMAYQHSGLSNVMGTQPSCHHLFLHVHMLKTSTGHCCSRQPTGSAVQSLLWLLMLQGICLWKHDVLRLTTWVSFFWSKRKFPWPFSETDLCFDHFCGRAKPADTSHYSVAHNHWKQIGFSLKFAYQCMYVILLKARYSTGVVCWPNASHTTLYLPDNTMGKAKNCLPLNRRCYLLHTQLRRRGYFSTSLPSFVPLNSTVTNVML